MLFAQTLSESIDCSVSGFEWRDRSGHVETYHSSGGILNKDVNVVILADKETRSGGELFVAALKESRSRRRAW